MYYNSYSHYQWADGMSHRNHHAYGYDNWGNPHWNHTYWGYDSLQHHSYQNDYGSKPFVVDMEQVTKQNNTFRTALWTGEHLQLTLMSIDVGGNISLEVDPNLDQFLKIEDGQGLVQMGDSKERADYQQNAYEGYAIFIPAGKWHNLTNTGNKPLKLYSIYAPPAHRFGTVHETKAAAMAAEKNNHHY